MPETERATSEKDRMNAISLYGVYDQDLEEFLADAEEMAVGKAENLRVSPMLPGYTGATAVAQSAEMPPAA